MTGMVDQGGSAAFHFGVTESRLYGFLHGSADPALNDMVAILAPSFGHEYARAHRSLVQLATRLADVGIPALRFDWSGVGDSAGDLHDMGVHRWIEDLGVAVNEARRRTARRKTVLIGRHWGGALAAMAAAARGDVDTLVLWDAVADGQEAIDDMQRVQQHVERSTTARFKAFDLGAGLVELVGVAWAESQFMALSRLKLLNVARRPAARALIVESTPSPRLADVKAKFDGLGCPTTSLHVPTPAAIPEDPFKPRVPLPLIQSIVRWVEG